MTPWVPPAQTKYSVSPLNATIGTREVGIKGVIVSVFNVIAGTEDVDLVDTVERIDDDDGARLRSDFVDVGVTFVKVIGIVGENPCNCDCDIENPGLCIDHCDNFWIMYKDSQ